MMAWSDCLSSTAWRQGKSGGRPLHRLLTEAPWLDTKPAPLTRHITRPGVMRKNGGKAKGWFNEDMNERDSFHLYKLIINFTVFSQFYLYLDLWRRKSLLGSLPQHQNWCYSDLWRCWMEKTHSHTYRKSFMPSCGRMRSKINVNT